MLRKKRSVKVALRRRLLFIAVMLLAGLGLAEVAARAVDALTGISIAEHRRRYQHRRHCRLGNYWPAQRGDYPYLPFIPNAADDRVNSLGFRGDEINLEKPANTYRIVCLGGSTTWDEYPALLQEELSADFQKRDFNLEVINAGDVYWTTVESQINLLTRGLPLAPDAVVVYHGINDAAPAFKNKPRLDYSHWRGRLEKNDPILWDHMPLWLDHSAAYVAFRAVFTRHTPAVGWNDMTTRYTMDVETDRYYGMEAYRHNLYNIIAIARSRGIEVFLCTPVFNYEYEFKSSLKRWGDAVADANRITRWFAGRWSDVHLIDVAGSLEGSNDWMVDMVHFSPEGKRRLARFIADDIRPRVDHLLATRNNPLDIAALIPQRDSRLAGRRSASGASVTEARP